MRDRTKDDPRLHPLLLDAVWLAATHLPKKIKGYLIDRLGKPGGLTYKEWDELIAQGLAEYVQKNGVQAHFLTTLGNTIQHELFHQRNERKNAMKAS